MKRLLIRLLILWARLKRRAAYWISALLHPRRHARTDDRRTLGAVRLHRHLFDADDYLERHEDVRESGAGAFDHFVHAGWSEGRQARFFDEGYYYANNRDVLRSGGDAYSHYRANGAAEQRPARFLVVQVETQDYEEWHRRSVERRRLGLTKPASARPPSISVVMPTYNTDLPVLDRAIMSVLSQSYDALELCICDDASPDPRLRERLRYWAAVDSRVKVVFREHNGNISAATNDAVALASGDYVAFMDHDDELAADALACVGRELAAHPDCVLLYSDEDKIDGKGKLSAPHFKSDFNYELLLAQNYINHLTVVRTDAVRTIGGLREGLEGAQDHDFLLRLTRTIPRSAIRHVPEVLYHWRMSANSTASDLGVKPYVQAAALKALSDHCAAQGWGATVSTIPEYGYYRVQADIVGRPTISIVIPTRDRVELLRQCIESLTEKTAYAAYEIIVADNDSREPKTLRYFEALAAKGVRVVPCPGAFNFSRINNQAVATATGEYVLLLNNDIEVIDGDWLSEMLRYAQMPDVGCVGARLWYPDKTLQHGGVILGIGGVAGHAHKYLPRGAGGYFCRAALPQQLSAVTAACLLVRKSIYDAVGGLDEALAVAFNDIDFCLRVQAAGYRNVWTPYAELIHHESKSRGAENSPQKQERFRQEVELMLSRWGDSLTTDPYYNPNLTMDREDFSMRRFDDPGSAAPTEVLARTS